jgi:hypothetical protein
MKAKMSSDVMDDSSMSPKWSMIFWTRIFSKNAKLVDLKLHRFHAYLEILHYLRRITQREMCVTSIDKKDKNG